MSSSPSSSSNMVSSSAPKIEYTRQERSFYRKGNEVLNQGRQWIQAQTASESISTRSGQEALRIDITIKQQFDKIANAPHVATQKIQQVICDLSDLQVEFLGKGIRNNPSPSMHIHNAACAILNDKASLTDVLKEFKKYETAILQMLAKEMEVSTTEEAAKTLSGGGVSKGTQVRALLQVARDLDDYSPAEVENINNLLLGHGKVAQVASPVLNSSNSSSTLSTETVTPQKEIERIENVFTLEEQIEALLDNSINEGNRKKIELASENDPSSSLITTKIKKVEQDKILSSTNSLADQRLALEENSRKIQRRCEELLSDISIAEKNFASSDGACKQVAAEIAKLNKDVELLENEIKTKSEANKALESDAANANKERETCQSELEKAKKKLADLESAVKEADAASQKAQLTKEETEKDYKAERGNRGKFDLYSKAMSDATRSAQALFEAENALAEFPKDDIVKLQEKLSLAEKQVALVQGQIEAAGKHGTELETRLNDLHAELSVRISKLGELEAQANQDAEGLAKTKSALESAEIELASAKSAAHAACQEFEKTQVPTQTPPPMQIITSSSSSSISSLSSIPTTTQTATGMIKLAPEPTTSSQEALLDTLLNLQNTLSDRSFMKASLEEKRKILWNALMGLDVLSQLEALVKAASKDLNKNEIGWFQNHCADKPADLSEAISKIIEDLV